MVYGVKNAETVSKKEIDEALADLNFLGVLPKADLDSFSSQVLSYSHMPYNATSHERGIVSVKRLFQDNKTKLDKKYTLSTFKDDKSEGYRVRAAAAPRKDFSALQADLSELPKEAMAELCEEVVTGAVEAEEQKKHILLAAAKSVEEVVHRDFEKNIEGIIKERWRYLVMQFGGVFLTEIRPNRILIEKEKKTLADMLIVYDKKEKKYGLDLQRLENYLKENSNGFVQIHFSDIMFNPKIKDYDIFSITSGEVNKANIFLDLAKFLSGYNKGKETIIPVHLPYYEKWKTAEKVVEFGKLDENGKRDAIMKAEKVLRYLAKKWNNNVKLALETGNGASERNGQINYALIYEPHHLKFLISGRENFVSVCEDVGHLNIRTAATNWKDYLTEEISEFHVSGNNGEDDEHTIATPSTLKNYDEIMSFLKFYTGNICAEIGKGELIAKEFVQSVKNLAYTLFSDPDKRDFENLRKIENYVVRLTEGKGKLCEKNLNQERYGKYREYVEKSK